MQLNEESEYRVTGSTNLTSKQLFERGVRDHATERSANLKRSGSIPAGLLDLQRAWAMATDEDELKPTYLRVLLDVVHCSRFSSLQIDCAMKLKFQSFSPNGKRFLILGEEAVQLWDANTCSFIRELSQLDSNSVQTKFGPFGDRVAIRVGNYLRLWNANCGTSIGNPIVLEGNDARLEFSSDETKVLVRCGASITFLNAQTGDVFDIKPRHDATITQVAFDPQTHRMLTCSDDIVREWDANTGDACGPEIKRKAKKIPCRRQTQKLGIGLRQFVAATMER